jgi:NAD(P)-dependent dehydrogenase (short-subunit alcohol dehydrogenase family)
VISSRTQADLESLALEIEALGRQATKVLADVTKTIEVEALAEQAVGQGGIDIWVNNAGGLPDATPRYLTKTPEDKWDEQMNLNLKAVFIACQVAAGHMDHGSIINISSSAAKSAGSVKNGPYSASKTAVNNLTETLALELAPAIRVNDYSSLAEDGGTVSMLKRRYGAAASNCQIHVPTRGLSNPFDQGVVVVSDCVSRPGDSGAPVLATIDGMATMIGLNMGCRFDISPAPQEWKPRASIIRSLVSHVSMNK